MTNQSHTELAAHMALVLAYANQMASRPRNEVLLNAQWKTIEASARKLAALESPERVLGEALKLPRSYDGGFLDSSPDGCRVSLRFRDVNEGEAWFTALTNAWDAAIVTKESST